MQVNMDFLALITLSSLRMGLVLSPRFSKTQRENRVPVEWRDKLKLPNGRTTVNDHSSVGYSFGYSLGCAAPIHPIRRVVSESLCRQ
jgi:hypothetical protein